MVLKAAPAGPLPGAERPQARLFSASPLASVPPAQRRAPVARPPAPEKEEESR